LNKFHNYSYQFFSARPHKVHHYIRQQLKELHYFRFRCSIFLLAPSLCRCCCFCGRRFLLRYEIPREACRNNHALLYDCYCNRMHNKLLICLSKLTLEELPDRYHKSRAVFIWFSLPSWEKACCLFYNIHYLSVS